MKKKSLCKSCVESCYIDDRMVIKCKDYWVRNMKNVITKSKDSSNSDLGKYCRCKKPEYREVKDYMGNRYLKCFKCWNRRKR